MSYTPGPWTLRDESRLSPDGSSNIAYMIEGKDSAYVGLIELGEFRNDQNLGTQTAHANARGHANARLIAAAPEMLEALKDIARIVILGRLPKRVIAARADVAIRKASCWPGEPQ